MTQIVHSTSSKQDTSPSLIVGIGASAGGLQALDAFFEAVETPSPYTFIVIQHLSPHYKSHMLELMANKTRLTVAYAKDRMPLQSNHLYLISPGTTLVVDENGFNIGDRGERQSPDFSINRFFQSLAETYGQKAIAIVLSGTGSDGTHGIRSIKSHGGTVMVQRPDSAKFDGMPRNALFTGLADYEIAPEEMFSSIKALIEKEKQPSLDGESEQDTLYEMLTLIKQQTGHDFHRYRIDMLIRRIGRRMTTLQIPNLTSYASLLHRKAEEVTLLRRELLLGVTRFFMDPDVFAYVEEHIIPNLFNQAQNRNIRVWVPACATGEEVYTIAILLHEYTKTLSHRYIIKIFGTDVNEEAVSFASVGHYPEGISNDISKERLNQYFSRTNSGYQVTKQIRDMIVFTSHDIISNAPFNRMDFISCRNLLVSFQSGLQQRVIALFNFSLNQGGYLLLGSNESAKLHQEIFSPESETHKVYRSVYSTRSAVVDRHASNSSPDQRQSRKFEPIYRYAPRKNLKNLILEANNQLITEELATACLVVNQQLELIRYFGKADRFLYVPNEPTNWNLMKMMNVELAASISAGVRKAISMNEKVCYPHLHCRTTAGSFVKLDLILRPYKIAQLDQQLIFVILREIESESSEPPASNPGEASQIHLQERIKDLEQELTITRENLQATIEELQTSNEELMASNEELQGTNEELQSVNEELYTINAEHQSTIEQLTQLNNDIDNLLQSGEVGIIFLDEKLQIRRFNQTIATEINIRQSDIGRPFGHFSSKLFYPDFLKDTQEVLKSGEKNQKEILSESGKWFFLSLMPYMNIYKEVSGIVITLTDISQVKDSQHLKHTIEELAVARQQVSDVEKQLGAFTNSFREREEAFRQAQQEIPFVQILVDHRGNGKSLYAANQGFDLLKIHQIEQAELPLKEIIPDQLADHITELIPAVISSGEKQQMDLPITIGEAVFQVKCTLIPVKKHCCLILLEDISTKFLLQKKEDRLQELVRLISDKIPDSSLLLFDTGLKVIQNGGPYFSRQVTGRSLKQVFRSSIRKQLGEAFMLTLAGDQFVREVRHKSEIFLYHFFPVHGLEEVPYAGMIIIQKITNIKKVKRDLEARIVDLEQFAHAVSHDLKTPLRSIVGFAQLLKNRYAEQLDSKAQEFIDFIVNNTMRMNDLIVNVLKYSTLDRENAPVEVVNTKEMVDQLAETVKHAMPKQKVNIVVGELPEIMANPAHLLQLFQNLIENGLKFNEKKNKQIHIFHKQHDGHWIFAIKDNGIGIEAKYHTQIFSIFQHLNDREKYKGNGIGLALCKRVTEKMNGDIWVESTTGEGSTFYVKIPIRPVSRS
ncbi:MAG: chemotaxis protein CheB [Bacteroidota bacterium]